ncbi:MAG: hypothetical protein MUE44_27125 [Oscillatoriaceae cyanobacterium Prado104]|nr:hypothetical protein [Oscillatoriaceae cyanobacterium Prado104]
MAVASAVFWGGSWKDSPDAYTTRKLYHCGDRICDFAIAPVLNLSLGRSGTALDRVAASVRKNAIERFRARSEDFYRTYDRRN